MHITKVKTAKKIKAQSVDFKFCLFCVLLYDTYYFVCGLRSDMPCFINE